MLDRTVESLVDRALAGEHLPAADVKPLLSLSSTSAEAAHIRWAAREITYRASNGMGQIYAQIGVDGLPCPGNCGFCSFAAATSTRDHRSAIIPTETIVEYAQAFDRAGVHLISLMATAALPFDHLLGIVKAVRSAISNDMPLLCNTGDLTFEQAQALKEAGVQACYHAHRLGEGTITAIHPAQRLETLRNIREAGLKLMSAVEPVHSETSQAELLQRMQEVASFEPYCAGVGTLTTVKGSAMEGAEPISRAHGAFLAAVFRLMVGEDVPFGTGGGNVVWSDAGTTPRARNLPVDAAALERDVARLRKELRGKEWTVPERPLPSWFE